MRVTRKKVIKTVYKDDDGSEGETGDFSDSGSDAHISEKSSSEDEGEIEPDPSSGDDFVSKTKKKTVKPKTTTKRTKFAKTLISKINKQSTACNETENDVEPALFSVKDLTEEDKLLPSILNLSESDSSEDESTNVSSKKTVPTATHTSVEHVSEEEENVEYKDVWSNNLRDDSEAVAKKAFIELEQHKNKIEETKASIQNYMTKKEDKESNVTDLLAQGEEVIPQKTPAKKKIKSKKIKDDSDSEAEDWEEVKESKTIPQQGLQLFVEFPDAVCRKKKIIDVEMMMKRKMNRVKKEHQVYLHKVHVLCWLGHGNYVSCVLNDQDLLAAALSLVPSKECYPGERVDMKYVEQISAWFKDKLTLKQDKNEHKFKPKAPHLKDLLLGQMKSRVVTTRKYLVFIFIAMLRALGLQCRVMFNLVTLPLKPPHSELCSLSTKPKGESKINKDKPKSSDDVQKHKGKNPKKKSASDKHKGNKNKLAQVDGNDDNDSDIENIMQVDGNDDAITNKARRRRPTRAANLSNTPSNNDDEGVSPPKRSRKSPNKIVIMDPVPNEVEKLQRKERNCKKINKLESNLKDVGSKIQPNAEAISPKLSLNRARKKLNKDDLEIVKGKLVQESVKTISLRQTRSTHNKMETNLNKQSKFDIKINNKVSLVEKENKKDLPKIVVTAEIESEMSSKYFDDGKPTMVDTNNVKLTRKRSRTADSNKLKNENESMSKQKLTKTRTKSSPGNDVERSKYFSDDSDSKSKKSKTTPQPTKKEKLLEDNPRVSHRDLPKTKTKTSNDVTEDLVGIIKNRIKDAKLQSKKGIVKGKVTKESDNDSDFLPEEDLKRGNFDSDDDFKPTKISPKPSTSRHIDRRVISPDEEIISKNKIDVWCEVYVEELEQWICVDIIKGKIHDTNNIYSQATHPMCYVIGWDNNNYLKDLTRRYVPHWNTVTRKQRAEPTWWSQAIQPWLGPKTARDREENEYLDKMQLEAPLPKSIAEYKNHPLYALKRHLLKFEAMYPPDASTLGFIRGEAVYSRDCVYTCRSRDTWLKEAKVVKLGEEPYKVVKARPKWDKLSNKLITDKPLEVFGPWQVQDYEPPVAENGIVPRNAYGNVELFKECMLPKGTAHIKLPGLNKVARKLNIDCAPAMTGFDFNGGWSHPVYDGFVVCKEFEEIITDAWVKDQEEQERRERERTEARVYGNWRKLIKGLLIRERIKNKYGFEQPSTSKDSKPKSKAPRLVVKKRT